jgi:penicillin-binding protein 2
MLLKALFPSMFHRRLLLLLAMIVISLFPLIAQMGRLTVVRGDELRRDAEARLVRRNWTPAVRGSILDRKGRILAQDRPSYDIAVDFDVIDGGWAERSARQAARRSVGAGWSDLKTEAQDELVARFRPAFLFHLEEAWNTLAAHVGMTREELDAKRDQTITEVNSKQDHATSLRLRREHELAAERKEELTPARIRALERRANQPIAEKRSPHVLASRVSDEIGFACQFLTAEEVELRIDDDSGGTYTTVVERVPGLRVIDGGDRNYPAESITVEVDQRTFPGPLKNEGTLTVTVDGVACHILGRVRDRVYGTTKDKASGLVTLGDADRRRDFFDANPALKAAALTKEGEDRGSYRDTDRVGDTGIEASQENYLRGLRGLQTRRLDSGERIFLQPVRGKDAQLTIDIQLQARVQALLSRELGLAVVQPWHLQESPTQAIGEVLNGAAVVLDVDTGDVLAMVSTPTYTRVDVRENPESVYNDAVNTPYVNRAVAKPYPPGSIVKPLISVSAVKNGTFRVGQTIDCNGHLLPDRPDYLQCWIWKRFKQTHTAQFGHEPNTSEAIMGSCNIFFFTLGRRLGPEGITSAFRDFGVGDGYDLGVGQEFVGSMGGEKPKENPNEPTTYLPVVLGDAIQMGIGQGPISWTPLHAADTYATLARGGVRVAPRIVMGQGRSEPVDLELDSSAVAEAMDGLRRAVGEDLGTGHHISIDGVREVIFNAPGVRVWGKTGTADAPAIRIDPDGPDGPQPVQTMADGDHSWFVVMVGRDRPRYIISVIVEYGGSGGKVSGPVTNQIIHALIAEGYL